MRLLAPLSLVSVVVLTTLACTDANVTCISAACLPADQQAVNNKLTFQGNACTANPNSVGYPYKVLFVVDVSGSTAQSDPTNGRGAAVRSILNQYASNPEVYFAIISFDSQPNILEPVFTQDQQLLQSVVPQLNLNRGSTNYLDTLTAVAKIISDDASKLSSTERARTRYDVQWLSDGVPNPCVAVSQILQNENQILDLAKTYSLFDIRLSTIFLTGANSDSCANTPSDIMPPMAALGHGTYQALQGSQLKFDIAFSEIVQPFTSQRFYLVNESRVVHNGRLLADSDRDGVADVDEKILGTDPTLPDTHKSGCHDRIDQLEAVNPNLCSALCSSQLTQFGLTSVDSLPDSDADGLRDCEEISMAMDRSKADSDGDNLIDPLEVRFGTNPDDAATLTADTDLDGTSDVDEIMQGTDPLSKEGDRSLAYVYQPLSSEPTSQRGVSCFSYQVSNVQLVETTATPTSNAGDNTICAYVEQLPQGDSSASAEPTVARSCFTANYKVVQGQGVKTPAAGVVDFTHLNFKPFICGSAPCK